MTSALDAIFPPSCSPNGLAQYPLTGGLLDDTRALVPASRSSPSGTRTGRRRGGAGAAGALHDGTVIGAALSDVGYAPGADNVEVGDEAVSHGEVCVPFDQPQSVV